MSNRTTVLALIATASVSLFVGSALGRSQSMAAEVRSPISLCTKVAAHGKARVTPLALGENAWLGRLEIAPGASVPEHRDATEEYIHILSGRGTIWINDQKFPVEPGATIYMPAKAKVRFKNGKTSMTALQVFAGPEPATKYASWAGCK